MRRFGTLTLVTALLTALSGCAGGGFRATRAYSLDVDWAGYERIVIESRNGKVDLAHESRNDLSVTGEVYVKGATPEAAERSLDDIHVVATPAADDPKTMHVRVEFPDALTHRSPGASLVLRMPAHCTASIKTSNGRVQVAKLNAPVDVKTSNGAVVLDEIGGPATVVTSNGTVTIRSVRGDVRAESSNGRIELHDVHGNVTAHTSNGRIVANVTPPTEAMVELVTSNGGIDASLPATVNGTVSATTSNGSVLVELPEGVAAEQSMTKRAYNAKLNGGQGGRIVLRTSNGPLKLRLQ